MELRQSHQSAENLSVYQAQSEYEALNYLPSSESYTSLAQVNATNPLTHSPASSDNLSASDDNTYISASLSTISIKDLEEISDTLTEKKQAISVENDAIK